MAFRKLSASYIFSAHSGFLTNGILILDSDNRVIDLIDTNGNLQEEANLIHYNGILTPAFVNIHWQAELSHLSGQIPHKTGSQGFNQHLITRRNIKDDQVQESILEEMIVFQQHNPQTLLKDLLTRVTTIRAKALGIESQTGSFEKGKLPGVNLIEHADLRRLKLTESSRIKKIA
jgi:cytosine/adenosine deaminase-related metal-dependent hydrolase